MKIVVTKCQILRLKCTNFDFGWFSAQDPTGRAYSAPNPPAGFAGPTSKREERRGEGRGRGKGREGAKTSQSKFSGYVAEL